MKHSNSSQVAAASVGQLLHGRYRIDGLLGTGTYGYVLRCLDILTNEVVAVKVAHREAAYRRSALNESAALQALANCPTVIACKETFEDEGRVCIVEELLHKNLYEVQRDQNFEPLPLTSVQQTGKCILKALHDLHVRGQIHCDVKPENVMLRKPRAFGDSCLIDFGAVRKTTENQYYDVQSLWYRAPEVICGLPYTTAIDLWSVGCLLFEMHTGNPLFPGNSPQHQMSLMIELMGPPSREAMQNGKHAWSLDFSAAYGPRHVRLEDSVATDQSLGDAFVDLLYGLLQPDERRRITAEDALRHPFFGPEGAEWVREGSITSITCSMNYSIGGATSTDADASCTSPEVMSQAPTSTRFDDDDFGDSLKTLPKTVSVYSSIPLFT